MMIQPSKGLSLANSFAGIKLILHIILDAILSVTRKELRYYVGCETIPAVIMSVKQAFETNPELD
jgi:hypothetical protein